MKDELGRNINYLRISVTDRCNLRCQYCMPEEGIHKKLHDELLTLEEIYQIVEAATALGVNKIRITGGEPLVRRGLTDLIKKISGLEEIKDIAMTTNGILLKDYAKSLKEAGLNRVNISLDSLDEQKYREITRGGSLKDVLEGIEVSKEEGLFPIKLNVVLVGGFNDNEILDFAKLTMKEEIHVRFIELMPIGQAASWAKRNFISNDFVKEQLGEIISVKGNDPSSPARYYKLPGAKGEIGLINPISSQFCMYCNRIRLTADGKLKPCLHSDKEIDIKKVLSEDNRKYNLQRVIKEAILSKPAKHTLNERDNQPIVRDMVEIGG